MDDKPHQQRFDAGLKTRREVLGAEYVDKSMSTTDDFNREFQELLNTYCWNDIWNRPGLSRHTRSLLNLAMLTALGKAPELKLHIRGALNNGVTKDEIKEVFLQAAIYAGVPAAVEAFRTAREVFGSEDREQKTEDRRQRTGDRRQKTEDRGQKTEDRRQRTGDRRQRTEDRGQRRENRRQRITTGLYNVCQCRPIRRTA